LTVNVLQSSKLPGGIDALSVLNADDSITIVVRASLSPVKKQAAVVHELAHIIRADFTTEKTDATKIEKDVRENTKSVSLKGIDFFYKVI
jgi:hypothetical protein